MDTVMMTTERLNLRKMTVEDVQNLMQILSDPQAMKYYPATMNEEEPLGWINRTLGNYKKLGVGFWIVEDKSTGRFLGQCGIIPQEFDGADVMEIAYLFVRQEWGNGYATESAKACMEYGFQHLGLHKMYSFIDANNLPSARVAKRNGMHVETTITKWGKDVLVYSVSR
jgi:RimJ/RimL family protein N-acetyltransferase